MDPDICPPYWPELIWWLLHHHGPTPPPPPDGYRQFDRLFANVAILTLARYTENAELTKAAAGAVRTSLEEAIR
jgi:hypothetical protein